MGPRAGLSDLAIAFSAISLLVTIHELANRSKLRALAAQNQLETKNRLAAIEQGIQAIHAKLV